MFLSNETFSVFRAHVSGEQPGVGVVVRLGNKGRGAGHVDSRPHKTNALSTSHFLCSCPAPSFLCWASRGGMYSLITQITCNVPVMIYFCYPQKVPQKDHCHQHFSLSVVPLTFWLLPRGPWVPPEGASLCKFKPAVQFSSQPDVNFKSFNLAPILQMLIDNNWLKMNYSAYVHCNVGTWCM